MVSAAMLLCSKQQSVLLPDLSNPLCWFHFPVDFASETHILSGPGAFLQI